MLTDKSFNTILSVSKVLSDRTELRNNENPLYK